MCSTAFARVVCALTVLTALAYSPGRVELAVCDLLAGAELFLVWAACTRKIWWQVEGGQQAVKVYALDRPWWLRECACEDKGRETNLAWWQAGWLVDNHLQCVIFPEAVQVELELRQAGGAEAVAGLVS